MNKCIFVGNLTRDPETGSTNSGISYCRFSIAVNRNYANANGEREADFINIVTWRGLADNCARYLQKGSKVCVCGQLQTRTYEGQDGTKRYDFQYTDRYGYTNTIGGISRLFDEEFWNYAKLISGVLRWRMPIDRVIKLVDSLQLDSESINTWKNGVERALKKYVTDGTKADGQKCPNCGHETLVYQEGCLICKTCGASRCG